MKILKNKRGFSLVELMVVVAIMGILSAIAIPSYLTYQDNARQGVAESVLHLVNRTIAIEVARGIKLSRVDADYFTNNIWAKVQSDAKGSFDPTFDKDGTDSKWCLGVQGTGDYSAVQGCVQNVEAGGAKTLLQTGDAQNCSTLVDATRGCSTTPSGCIAVTGTPSPGTPGTCTGTYSLTAVTCAAGICS